MKTNRKVPIEPEHPAINSLHLHRAMKDYLGYCLMKLSLQIRTRVEQELAQFDMVAPQAGILVMLSQLGPLTQVQLGRLMCIDKASMVRFLDGLESRGYVHRQSHPEDRRAKVLSITKEGEKVLLKTKKYKRQAEAEFLRPLTKREGEEFRRLVWTLVLRENCKVSQSTKKKV